MTAIPIAITRLPHAEGLDLPAYATASSAGLDLAAAVTQDIAIAPNGRALIPTGFAIALPAGFEAQVRPRSGLALKHGVTVLNSPGTIDSDYRGEIGVILVNHGSAPFVVTRGQRIAQLVVAPVSHVTWQVAETLPDSARGAGGFGSTGTAKIAAGVSS